MKLIPIDPKNPPQYKKQMLFYSEKWKLFRLGSVDYTRIDDNGTHVIYTPFELVKVMNAGQAIFNFNFEPTHYLDLELSDLAKTIENETPT